MYHCFFKQLVISTNNIITSLYIQFYYFFNTFFYNDIRYKKET